MNAGMSAETFRQIAAAMARVQNPPSDEPVAVFRCEDGWRTLFADGSSHRGRPCSRVVMEELGEMVDHYRADRVELEGLARLWDALEQELGQGTTQQNLANLESALATENRGAADAAGDIIDVDAVEDEAQEAQVREVLDELAAEVDADLESLAQEMSGETPTADIPQLELQQIREDIAPDAPQPQGAQQWRTTSTFVPWSVVETMIDAELDGYFRRHQRRAS